MDDVFAAGRIPLLAGGTMMYFRALTEGIAELPAADASIRRALDAEAAARGWPAMHATVSGDGWMGIAPSDKEIEFCSLDIWRCEDGRLRENWVLIDLLDIYDQLGVDVLARMREITVARQPI